MPRNIEIKARIASVEALAENVLFLPIMDQSKLSRMTLFLSVPPEG
jgi:hypothetical protein